MNYIESAKEAGHSAQVLRERLVNTIAVIFFPIHGFYMYWTDPQELPEVREKMILAATLGMIFFCFITVFTYFREWPHALLWATFYLIADVIYWLVYFFGPIYYTMDKRG